LIVYVLGSLYIHIYRTWWTWAYSLCRWTSFLCDLELSCTSLV